MKVSCIKLPMTYSLFILFQKGAYSDNWAYELFCLYSHPTVVSQTVVWKWLFPQLCSINKYDKNQYSILKLSITFSFSLFCHLHFSFSFYFSIEESHRFLLSSSLITILEVPLNINVDWLQDSIWFYYLTLTC